MISYLRCNIGVDVWTNDSQRFMFACVLSLNFPRLLFSSVRQSFLPALTALALSRIASPPTAYLPTSMFYLDLPCLNLTRLLIIRECYFCTCSGFLHHRGRSVWITQVYLCLFTVYVALPMLVYMCFKSVSTWNTRVFYSLGCIPLLLVLLVLH